MVDRFFRSDINFLRFWKHRFLRFTSFWTKGRWNFHFFKLWWFFMIFQTYWPVEASWTKFRTLSTFEHANFDSPCYHRGDFTPKLKKWSLFRLLTSHHHLSHDDFFAPFKTMNLSICYELGYRWRDVEIFVEVDFWLFPHFQNMKNRVIKVLNRVKTMVVRVCRDPARRILRFSGSILVKNEILDSKLRSVLDWDDIFSNVKTPAYLLVSHREVKI